VSCKDLKKKLDWVLTTCNAGGQLLEGPVGDSWLRGWTVDTCGQAEGQEVIFVRE
jgi:hypothetical protein